MRALFILGNRPQPWERFSDKRDIFNSIATILNREEIRLESSPTISLVSFISVYSCVFSIQKDPSWKTIMIKIYTSILLLAFSAFANAYDETKPSNQPDITKSAIPTITLNGATYGTEAKVVAISYPDRGLVPVKIPARAVDVLQIIRASRNNFDGNKIYIPANMNQFFGGDPFPNEVKVVSLQIQVGNQAIHLRQIEGKELKFPGVGGIDYWIVQ